MPVLVKICGLGTPDALDAALAAGADLVGFVFFPPSPRHLGLDVARMLGARVKGRAGKVALSVDADDATLAAVVEALQPDKLQLHGKESPDRGLGTPDALDAALAAGADLVGFVFFPPSPRHLGLDVARMLGARVKGRAGKVALSVDADDATLAAVVEALQPDMLQLHGKESPARVTELKRRHRRPVMKAIPVETVADLAAVPAYADVADTIIFDARAPRAATRPGGLGKPFDWRLLRDVDRRIPFMLSGGLDAGNVAEAIAITRAGGVDVSSGVERTPGVKDPDKIVAFIRTVRAATPQDITSPA